MGISPLVRIVCEKVLPLVYDDSLSYYEVLCKVQCKINEMIVNLNDVAEKLSNIDGVIEEKATEIINEKLQEWYNDGTLEKLINEILFKEYAYFNLTSIRPSSEEELSLETLYSNLISLYDDNMYFNYTKIGSSVNGVPIYDFCIGKESAYYDVLAFGNHHGREYQSVYVLYNDIRYIMENLNNKNTVRGTSLTSVFNSVRLHIVLSFNPDIYNIIINKENFYNLPDETQTNMKQWLVDYFQAGKVLVGTDVTQDEYNTILARCGGDIANYEFSVDELHIWKSNANGVDLHYNCWNDKNESVVKSWATSQGWSTTPSPIGYIGESGFSEPENVALLNLITTYGIKDIIDLHQRGPTLFYAYKYGGELYARNTCIARDLGRVTQTPISHSNSGRVGFTGWFYANYEGFACVKEIGWSYTEHYPNGSYNDSSTLQLNPLPTNTLKELFENEKNLLPFYCEFYGRKMDNWKHYNELHRIDVAGLNSQVDADNQYYLVSLDYMLKNYKRTLTEASDDVTLLTLGKTNVVGTRHVMYLSASNYPNIERPSDSPTKAGTLIRDSAGTMFIYHFYPIGFNREYMCTGYSDKIGGWKRIDS